MREKLTIKNFGPIKSVEIELGRFNVLIGESGTGKSTIAKIFAVIKNLLYSKGEGESGFMRESELNSLSHFKKHLAVYEIDAYLTNDSFINLNGREIDFRLENGIIDFNYETLIRKNFLFNNSVTYIPADRIATSLFSASTFADLIDVEEGRVDMPKYFLRFFSLFNRLKKRREYDFTEILDVKFKQINGVDKIILKNGKVISINESSSAVQSNLSLLTVFDWQTRKNKDEVNRSFIIEEPELNLFPGIQNKLMKHLVNKITVSNDFIFATTHSPYILTSLNNLMYAYEVGQKEAKETDKIIDKKYWINPNDVSAYMLLTDGTCEDIVDREEGLIKAEKIDLVSRVLNEEFEALSNLEFARR